MDLFEVRNSFEHLDKLSYDIGPRLAGTGRSRQASEYIKQQFDDFGLETSFQVFDFVNAIKKVRARVTLLAVIFIASLFMNFYLNPLLTLAIVLSGCGVAYVLPRFLPGEKDRNVIGTLKQEGEVEKRILVGAHYDSANCIKGRKLGSFFGISLRIVLAGFIGLLISTIFIGKEIWLVGWLVTAVPYLFVCTLPFWFYEDLVSPGADDNASGVSVMLEVARVCSEHPPENVEITFVGFGAEEQGLKGSEAFLNEFPAPDLFLNIDSVGGGDELSVIQGNGVFRKHRTTSKLNKRIREEGNIKSVWTPLAGHDHIPFLEKNVESTTLSSSETGSGNSLDRFFEKIFKLSNVRSDRLSHLHTIGDVPEKIKLENIKNSGEIILSLLEINEKK